ncbi:uncharacterized protein LOC144598870 isoform X2 [Rhinoraja longicauda]
MATTKGHWQQDDSVPEKDFKTRDIMDERIADYVFSKVNITKQWMCALLDDKRPLDAAIRWTASTAHKKSVEKAVWLTCYKKQVQLLDRVVVAQAAQIRDLQEEVEEKAAGGNQLIEALDSLNKERRVVTNRHEARVELMECQITEAMRSKGKLREQCASLSHQLETQEEKLKGVRAAYKMVLEDRSEGADHGACLQEIEGLRGALNKASGLVYLMNPPAGQSLAGAKVPVPIPRKTMVASAPRLHNSPSYEASWKRGSVGEREREELPVEYSAPAPMCPVLETRRGPTALNGDAGPIQSEIVVPHSSQQLRAMIGHVIKLSESGDPSLHFREIEQTAAINGCDEGERTKLLLFSLDSSILQCLSDESKRGTRTYDLLRDEVLEVLGVGDEGPFARLGKTLQMEGEPPRVFAARLWTVYQSSCPHVSARDDLAGNGRAQWLRCLVSNSLAAVREQAKAWFDPTNSTEEAVLDCLTVGYRNTRSTTTRLVKGKVHVAEATAPAQKGWRQEGNPTTQSKCFKCGKVGHWRKDCRVHIKGDRVGTTQRADVPVKPEIIETMIEVMRSLMTAQGKVAVATGSPGARGALDIPQ